MARFLALYQGEYSRERLILRLRTVHPKTITRLAQNDTGNVADRHMKQILSIYNGAGRMNAICDTTAKSETISVKGCKVKITYASADTDCLDAIQKLLQTTILRTAGHTAA